MDREPRFHRHPLDPEQSVFGLALNSGDIIEKGDVFDSPTGKWQADDHFTGAELPVNKVYWVRPVPEPEVKN